MKTTTPTPEQEARALSPIDKIAMSALAGSSDALSKLKQGLAAGQYRGTINVRVDYVIDKAPEYSRPPTINLLSLAVVAKAIVMSGAQGQNFLNALKKAALEAYAAGETVADTVKADDARVLEQIEAIKKEVVAALPLSKASGSTKVLATAYKVSGFVASELEEPQSKVA